MKLLYTKRSPYARKIRVVALEKNIALDLIDEDLQKKSQRLLDANPLGKVPTLVLDNGTTVFDSPVICQYLDNLNDNIIMIPRSLPLERIDQARGLNCFDECRHLGHSRPGRHRNNVAVHGGRHGRSGGTARPRHRENPDPRAAGDGKGENQGE